MIVRVKFGQTHAVTEMGDIYKGKREVSLACRGVPLVIDRNSEHRYVFLDDEPAEHAACEECRKSLGLTESDRGVKV